MLRSLKSGVSGYVRLERRTLMGTLQFTINGIDSAQEMYAVLLYPQNGAYGTVRLEKFPPPRYGQTGLVWKFDPRNIEGRTLEQYSLAAVIVIQDGICELLLCGNLNGSFEADWALVRDAACRLFSPVRISGSPIPPIDEESVCKCEPNEDKGLQTLPEFDSEPPAYPGENSEERSTKDLSATEDAENAADETGRAEVISETAIEPDEFDFPAGEAAYAVEAKPSQAVYEAADAEEAFLESDELDTPAQDDFTEQHTTAGDQLGLSDPDAEWPADIEPIRKLFFASEPIVPFETDGFVFIRAPLSADSDVSSCLIGIYCENGVPDRICYAIPSVYTPEPPAGMEGYVWRGDHSRGYWVICEEIKYTESSPSEQ